MTAQEIRKAYLDFFAKRGHKVIPRANLVPQDDATTLFTGSGMQPLVPYLLGAKHPEGRRLANSQTCLRAEDIEEVGDNRHTTFFEMLGNWSLGDYFKKEQLPWFFEFLVDEVGLDPKKLYVTCFIGAPELGIPKDTEAAGIWEKLFKDKGIDSKQVDIGSEADGYQKGMQEGRIFFYDGSKNWWSRGGAPASTPVGDPCGPDSEVFYDFGTPHDRSYGEHCHPNCDCGRFLEIGNSVFMAYKRTNEGFEPLPKPNVDFGGGLERIAAAQNGDSDVFKISLLWPVIEKLQDLTGVSYEPQALGLDAMQGAGEERKGTVLKRTETAHHSQATQQSAKSTGGMPGFAGQQASAAYGTRVIADHLRAAFWLAVDGVEPSNKDRGYVMRRLLRRAMRYGLKLGIEHDLCIQVGPTVAEVYKANFPEVNSAHDQIIQVFEKEERVFRQTLKKGVREFSHMTADGKLTGQEIFTLYDTYGFPVELSLEEADAFKITLEKDWQHQFDHFMTEQKERSRTATQGQFKGGLGGHSDMHKKYHTATHLMYKALKMVLGDHVVQRGSNITEERLRFDFSHPEKMTPQQIAEVEKIVNEQIKKDWPMGFREIPTKQAMKEGALGAFGDKYGETVKVYTAGDPEGEWFSKEICGGPHVEHTGELGEFKITKEESSSAGVRRIKAVLK